jgi:predicted ArsR family transcriptional regulator
MGITAEVDGHPTRAVSSRLRVLRAVRDAPQGRGVHELAAEVGLHPNTVRFHLDRLEDDGLVQRQVGRHSAPGRPPLRFTAVAQPSVPESRRGFQELAELLAHLLSDWVPGSPELTEQAGEAWARRLMQGWTGPAPDAAEAITMLADALASVGFDPQIASDPHQISLVQRRCPFLEVAKEHRDVVCSVQLGLIRGVLERLGAPVEVIRMVPFATPQGCLVQFAAR